MEDFLEKKIDPEIIFSRLDLRRLEEIHIGLKQDREKGIAEMGVWIFNLVQRPVTCKFRTMAPEESTVQEQCEAIITQCAQMVTALNKMKLEDTAKYIEPGVAALEACALITKCYISTLMEGKKFEGIWPSAVLAARTNILKEDHHKNCMFSFGRIMTRYSMCRTMNKAVDELKNYTAQDAASDQLLAKCEKLLEKVDVRDKQDFNEMNGTFEGWLQVMCESTEAIKKVTGAVTTWTPAGLEHALPALKEVFAKVVFVVGHGSFLMSKTGEREREGESERVSEWVGEVSE